jgi:hypothetical protein
MVARPTTPAVVVDCCNGWLLRIAPRCLEFEGVAFDVEKTHVGVEEFDGQTL